MKINCGCRIKINGYAHGNVIATITSTGDNCEHLNKQQVSLPRSVSDKLVSIKIIKDKPEVIQQWPTN